MTPHTETNKRTSSTGTIRFLRTGAAVLASGVVISGEFGTETGASGAERTRAGGLAGMRRPEQWTKPARPDGRRPHFPLARNRQPYPFHPACRAWPPAPGGRRRRTSRAVGALPRSSAGRREGERQTSPPPARPATRIRISFRPEGWTDRSPRGRTAG